MFRSIDMRIDAHQHFWKYSVDEYGWIDDSMTVLKRDFLPQHLSVILKEQGLDGCIAVQARQTVEETRWLLDLAERNPFIKGVVGWVDLCNHADEQLAEFSESPKLVGVRHVLQDEPDDRFMLRKDFLTGIAKLGSYDLVYDILIFPRHLVHACELVKMFPQQRFVLDHIAKPFIKDRVLSPWSKDIRKLAEHPNVSCKVSGMVTEADWHNHQYDDFTPCLDVVFESFSPDRIMFGSDWPVCTVADEYRQVLGILQQYCRAFSAFEQDKVFGVNATNIYHLIV